MRQTFLESLSAPQFSSVLREGSASNAIEPKSVLRNSWNVLYPSPGDREDVGNQVRNRCNICPPGEISVNGLCMIPVHPFEFGTNLVAVVEINRIPAHAVYMASTVPILSESWWRSRQAWKAPICSGRAMPLQGASIAARWESDQPFSSRDPCTLDF